MIEPWKARCILGLDLSATAPAAVAVPCDWNGDWRKVQSRRWQHPLTKEATDNARAMRCRVIAFDVWGFAQLHHCTEAWIESYAFGMKTAAHTLAEVGGVVRSLLDSRGMQLHTANMSSARKLLLGKIPRGKGLAKKACSDCLSTAGAPAWSLDESDAFVAANLGLYEAGELFFGQRGPTVAR
jgi:hypothetical protein